MAWTIILLLALTGALVYRIRARRAAERAGTLRERTIPDSPQEQLTRAITVGILRAVAVLAAIGIVIELVLSLLGS
jgi:hypothetical protein